MRVRQLDGWGNIDSFLSVKVIQVDGLMFTVSAAILFDIESMSKEGYELEMTQRGYGAVGGSQASPVLFRLWRNDIKEPLIAS